MGDRKPNVIPTQEMINEANKNAANEPTFEQPPVSEGEQKANDDMLELTNEQIRNQKNKKYLQQKLKEEGELDERDRYELERILALERRPDLAETETETYITKREEPKEEYVPKTVYQAPDPVSVNSSIKNAPIGYRPIQKVVSQQAYDLIPLPSEGKIYPHKRKSIKVAYLNASDENILTSPNLIQSGEFINVLLERKILDEDINLKDLHSGDRNAILIWLRATGYGSKYPIIITDPITGEEINTIFDLNTLKTKKLGDEPDREGLLTYTFKRSNTTIKYKLLTVGDLETIDTYIEYEREILGLDAPNIVNHRFRQQIVEVNGSRDINVIDEFINSLRIGDSLDFSEHIDKIESGVDLAINIEVPGREPVATFLPLTQQFFWPNERI